MYLQNTLWPPILIPTTIPTKVFQLINSGRFYHFAMTNKKSPDCHQFKRDLFCMRSHLLSWCFEGLVTARERTVSAIISLHAKNHADDRRENGRTISSGGGKVGAKVSKEIPNGCQFISADKFAL
jgi:hypothetical protein